MSSIGQRTEADYEIRLTELVAIWEKRHPDDAAALRQGLLASNGLSELPPVDSLRRQTFDRLYREEVRKRKGWPSLRAWMRGEG
jgi:hypothetical protein